MRGFRAQRWHSWGGPLLVAAFVAALPVLGWIGPVLEAQLLLAATYGLVVAGFNLGFGYAGQLALGQVAVFAGGAYATAILFKHGVSDLAIAIPVSIAVAAALGFLTGLPGLRFRQWVLAFVSFFLVVLIPSIVVLFENETGGLSGLYGIIGPHLLGIELSDTGFYVFSMVVVFACLLLFTNVTHSRYGQSLLVLKQGDALATSVGIAPFRLRLSAYVLGSLPAGVAGALYAYQSSIVSPDLFTLSLVTLVMAISVVAGVTSIWAAPVAAAIVVIGTDQLGGLGEYSTMVYGLLLMGAGVGFSGGISALGGKAMARIRHRGAIDPTVSRGEALVETTVTPRGLTSAGSVLHCADIAKRFGGVEALRGVDFEAHPGAVTAIIGANGAGKTTLLNAITGHIKIDAGVVRLGDAVISSNRPERTARAGVARTFQTPQIPELLTVRDVAASARTPKERVWVGEIALRTPRYRRLRKHSLAVAEKALAFVGLAADADRVAVDEPLAKRRMLEVARCIAADPAVILLDEPAAGLDPDAIERLKAVLRQLRDAGATVVVIEHNVNFVMDVADTVVVMDLGTILAKGPPNEVRNDERVIASYLGRRSDSTPSDIESQKV